MSISRIQKELLLEEVTKYYFLSGEKPLDTMIFQDVSSFFAENPVGQPFKMNLNNIFTGIESSPEQINDAIMRAVINLSILYESLASEAERSMRLFTIVSSRLESLRIKRDRIESDIDDYLLALNSTFGFFYSFSDKFSSLDYTDVSYTSAFVDVESNNVSIPYVPELTKPLPSTFISLSDVSVTGSDVNTQYSYTETGVFDSITDGLSNTKWNITTYTENGGRVTVVLKIDIASQNQNTKISKITINPYTVKPMRIAVEAESSNLLDSVVNQKRPFGTRVPVTANKATFVDDFDNVSSIYITMQKDEPDYILDSGQKRHAYTFGLKDLEVIRAHFDQFASFVTVPISLPEELAKDHVIDAVSVKADYAQPVNTGIQFFIATDSDSASSINDFAWKSISLEKESDAVDSGSILKLNGARVETLNIVSDPIDSDIKLIDFDTNNTNLSQRNPNTTIIPGIDIYRIAEFTKDFIPQTIRIEEGLNTLRTLALPLDANAVSDLSYWADYVNKVEEADEYYVETNTGNGFFYGGNLGENSLSVYAETYLESLIDRETIIKQFIKSDANSQQWDVEVWLNGRSVGSLPKGTDSFLIPWTFKKGLNHIAITANIPDSSVESLNPYLGILDIMVNDSLENYGIVKLANWSYVDIFHMKYNESEQPNTFTIYEGEIISRKKPTSNFRLHYTSSTGEGPYAIRLRVDMERAEYNDAVSPVLNNYSIKFSYGER